MNDSLDAIEKQTEAAIDVFSPDHVRFNTLFEPIDKDVFLRLLPKLERREHSTDDIIIEEGGMGEELFFLVEGRVKILHETKKGVELLLGLLHPGDFFGEMELIDGRTIFSRVVAADPCVVYTLRKNDFEALVATNHQFVERLMRVMCARLRSFKLQLLAEFERNHDKNIRERNKLKQIIDAAQNVNSKLELNEVVDAILETALRLLDAERGTIYMVDEKQEELWSLIYKGPKIKLRMGQGIAGHVAATGDTVNIPDAYLDPRFNPEVDKQSGYRTKTMLCLPMTNRDGKIIGVFQLLNKRTGRFTIDDEQLLLAFSAHAAIAVENARLYAQERLRIAMEKDMIAAMEVQKTLLPHSVPNVNGFEFAARSSSAKNVGGDLYDFITIDEHHLAFTLGDVTGKGLPASLLMANAQATIRSNTYSKVTPKQCMERSNALLYNTIAADKFVTLFFGILDTEHRTIHFSNAGQENPLIIRDGAVLERLVAGGIPLGMMGEAVYDDAVVSLRNGDVVALFSDGITEAFDEENNLWGEEGLVAVLEKHSLRSPEEIIEHVWAAIKEYTHGAPQTDDITIMVLKCVLE
jgi:serine phosphatase RsbU (regulator of sigma subunit)/CRP-like cAMP-binding protein